MKLPSVGIGRVTLLLAVPGAIIAYLIAEVLTLGLWLKPILPLSVLLADVLGFGIGGALSVLASAMVVTVGSEGIVISFMRGKIAPAPKAATTPAAPQGLERSTLDGMLHDSSKNFVEVFPLKTGRLNVYAAITKEEGAEGYRYLVIEPELTDPEKKQFAELKELLIEEMDVDLRSIESPEKAESFISSKVAQLARTYGYNIPRPSMRKLQYYFTRDFFPLGKIEPLMPDPQIEDISCVGANIPIYVWHRDYESIPTNVLFPTDKELDTFVSKLAYVSGKHISLAQPLVDASLHDGSRLHLTYGKEVTQRGSTFCMKSGHVQLSNGLALDIAQLFEDSKAKWGSRFEQGNEIVDVDGKISVVGANEETLEFSKSGVKQILKLPPPEALVKVWIQEGERSSEPFEVTKNHKFHVVTSDGLRLVEAADLKPNTWIPVPTKIPLEGVRLAEEDFRMAVFSCLRNSDLKLLVSLEGEALRLAEEAVRGLGGHHQAEKALGVTRNYLSDALVKTMRRNGTSSMRLTTFFDLLEAAGIKPTLDELFLRRRDHKVRIPLRLTEDLAFIIGWTLADGLLGSQFLKVTPSDPLHRDEIARAFKEVFGLDYHVYGTAKRYFDMHYLSCAVSDFLRRVFEVPKAPKSRSIRVPKFIMMSDDRVVSAFLRGVFQGDGSFARPYQASLKSFSRLFLRDVQFLLTRFGVLSFVTSDSRLGIPVSYQDVFFDDIMRLERDVHQVAGRVGKVVPAPFAESLRARAKSAVTLEMLRVEAGVELRAGRKLKITFDKARRTASAIGIDLDKHWFFDLVERGYDFKRISKVEVEANTDHVYDVVCGPDHFYVGGVVPSIVYDTIRKFRADPLTIIDLIKFGTLNAEAAAYLWYLIERRMSMLIAGPTASGKTTLLNCLSMFIIPGQKVISVEDSVTGDAEILVSEDGAVRKTKIGPFIDAALSRESMTTMFGHELARPGSLRVLTADASGRVTWGTCTALIRHRVKKEFVKVTTRSGRSIEVTADHSLFTLGENGDVVELSGRDIDEGTYILAPRVAPIDGADRTFDLGKLSEFSDYWFKAAPDAGGGLRVHATHSRLSIPSVIELDEDLAFLSGLWVADGFYDLNTVGLSAGGKGIEERIRGIARSYGVNVSRHSDGISLLINSKPLKTLFQKTIGLTGDDYSRHVPDVFFGATDTVVASFLRGYFTGDGNVSRSEVYAESASRQLLLDVQTLLLRFGINMKVGTKRKVGTLGGLGTYRAAITGKDQVANFKQTIGLEQPAQMRKIHRGVKRSSYAIDPVPLPGPLADELRAGRKDCTDASLRANINAGIRRGAASRRSILDLGAASPEFKRTRAYLLAASEFNFDRVVSVERSFREENVYDLSVPETGTFVANNIVCHNTPEILLPHENWIQEVTRGVGTAQEITLFDLVRNSLRQRPDIIIVGEIRGNEAFTLFQAISTGHGGLSTVHADSVESVFNRLTTDPMNIPRSLVGTTLDCIVLQLKLRIGDRSVRRVVSVSEILGYDNRTNEMIMNEVYKWDPTTDRMLATGRGRLVDKIFQRYGTRPEEIRRDLESRKVFLEWLAGKSYRSYKEVSNLVQEFYTNPYAMASRARTEMEMKK